MPKRYRELQVRPVVASTLVIDYIVGGSDADVGDFTVDYHAKTMSDVVTPGFSNKIRSGAIINNPCVYTESELSCSGSGLGHYRNTGGTTEYELRGPLSAYRASQVPLFPGKFPSPSLETDRLSRAKLVALANIDSTPYAFGEDAAEIGETLRFLKNPFNSLLKLSFSLRNLAKARQARNRFLSLAEATAEAWLSYRFAMMPLVRSCSNVVEALSSSDRTYPKRLSAHGRARSEGTRVTPYTHTNGRSFSGTRTESDDFHASILYEVSNPIRDWSWRYGFRGKDLPTTAWQVVPLSFMVDRLLDISSFSKAVINLGDPRIKILSGSTTYKRDRLFSYRLTNEVTAGWTISTTGDTMTERTFSYSRAPWYPTVNDAVPKLSLGNLVNDSTKIADLISLILVNVRH